MAECSLINLGSCLPEIFFNYLQGLIVDSLSSVLDMIKYLLSEPVNLDLFFSLWVIVVYVLSMFYAFLIMYSGFNFIISGYDSAKRENAKGWLRNTVIMVILIQASFFIYALLNDLSSTITSSVLTLAPGDFFSSTIDSFPSFALEFLAGLLYLLSAFVAIVLLILRYAIVALGVMFFPLGIFAYFVPPLRSYGLFTLNFIGTAMFVPILDGIILIGFSKMLTIPFFHSIQIIVMASALALINILMFFLMFFSLIQASVSAYSKAGRLITAVG